MIKDKTVLILGAGASVPYGLPTAKDLRALILKIRPDGLDPAITRHLAKHFMSPIANMERIQVDFTNSNIPSIDKWLALNPDCQLLGKVLIAEALLTAERNAKLVGGWYQTILNELTSDGPEFDGSKLSIITFNYDLTLEHFLTTSFRNYIPSRSEDDARKMLDRIKILHVYESLGELNPSNPHFVDLGEARAVAYFANRINIARRNQPSPHAGDIAELLMAARRWIFLGFGFDSLNIDALGFTETEAGNMQERRRQAEVEIEVHATMMGLTESVIQGAQRRIGHIKFRDCDAETLINSLPIFE